MAIIKTTRIILRPWKEEDLEPFAKLNSDPRVMEYFPSTKNREESDEMVRLMQAHIERCGWGFWAASLIETNEFIGLIGLEDVYFTEHFTPAVEIGWCLAFQHWGKGYASEGALAALKYGFETLELQEIVSFTAIPNQRSRRVMEKIGMHYDPKDNFESQKVPKGHPLKIQEGLGSGRTFGHLNSLLRKVPAQMVCQVAKLPYAPCRMAGPSPF